MLSGTARYSAITTDRLSSRSKSLSDDPNIEALLQDIPFFAVGLLGFGAATIMFVCRGMARPGVFIVASIVLAFVAATLDLARILDQMVATDDPVVSSLYIAREVCIALGLGARFLFFWDYAARSPSLRRKSQPSLLHMAVEAILIIGSVGVAVLQTVWRLAPNTNPNHWPVYLADMTLELVLGAIVVLQIMRFAFHRPIPAQYIRRSTSIVCGIAIQMGVSIGGLFQYDFEDSTLGRFLQAIALYFIVLVVLVMSMDNTPSTEKLPQPNTLDVHQRPTTSRSSFFNAAVRNSISNIRSLTRQPSANSTVARRPSMVSRRQTVDRVSNWITRRLSTSARTDKGEHAQASARLWTRMDDKDPEVATQTLTVDEKGLDTAGLHTSPGGFPEQQIISTWRNPAYTAVDNGVVTPMTTESSNFPPPARPESDALPLSPLQAAQLKSEHRSSIATSVIIFPSSAPAPDASSRRSSRTGALTLRTRSMTDSPVFGLDGIIRNLGLKPRSPPVVIANNALTSGTASSTSTSSSSTGKRALLERQAELDDSVARLNLLYPAARRRISRSESIQRSSGGDVSTELYIEPSSFKSEFSLSGLSSFPAPPEISKEVVDDVAFELIPPPVAGARAANGAPLSVTSTGSSLLAEYYSPIEGRPSVEAFTLGRSKQLDVTSFIGNLSMPRSPNSEPPTPRSPAILDAARNVTKPLQPSPLKSGESTTSTANPPLAMLRGPAPPRVGTAASSVAPAPDTQSISSPISRVASRDALRAADTVAPARGTDSTLRRTATSGTVRSLPISGPIPRQATPAATHEYEQPRAAPAPGT